MSTMSEWEQKVTDQFDTAIRNAEYKLKGQEDYIKLLSSIIHKLSEENQTLKCKLQELSRGDKYYE